MTIPNRYLAEALAIIAAAHKTYPDSRNLALNHAEMLAECGSDIDCLEACEAFTLRFGVDDRILALGLKLRWQIGTYDRLSEAGRHSISLCMIVKNEQSNIARCLARARKAVHEMIVVDTGSSDRTADISTLFGARISRFDWNGNFSDARNHAINQAAGDWILVLDADEVVSAPDCADILRAVKSSADRKTAWSINTRNYTTRVNTQGWTANDGAYPVEEAADGWYPSWKVRLFPNNPEIRFSGEVHEMVESSLRQSGFTISRAPFVVHHYGELASPDKDLDKQLNYFTIGMKKLEQNPHDLVAVAELAVQAGELGQFEQAISLWDRLLTRMPDAVEALFNKGYCLISLKRYDEALVVSRRALELDPAHKEAAFNYGTCELYVGSPERALELVNSIASRNREYPLLQALMVLLYLSSDQINQAYSCYCRVLMMDYNFPDYLRMRADTLTSLGRKSIAVKLLDGLNIMKEKHSKAGEI